jgi:predicted transcriptional regulator
MTTYHLRMTMLSFRVDDELAQEAQAWADELGVDRSELLREALRRQLARLGSERDSDAWEKEPLTPEEQAIGATAEWGPAEDWSDWSEAPGDAAGSDAAR